MSKKQTTTAVENTPATLPAMIDETNVAQALAAMDSVEDSNLIEAEEQTYLEFEEGDVQNLAFLGISSRTFDENGVKTEKDIAEFTDKEGRQFYNGNAYLVNRLKTITAPNLVRIVCTGKEKNKNGNGFYKTFKILSAIK